MGLLIGVTVSTLAIGTTLNLMNKGLEKYIPTQIPVSIASLPQGVKVERASFEYQGKNYELVNSPAPTKFPTVNISTATLPNKSNTNGPRASAASKLRLRRLASWPR